MLDVPFVFVTAVRAAVEFKNNTRMFPVYVELGLTLAAKNRNKMLVLLFPLSLIFLFRFPLSSLPLLSLPPLLP